MAVEIVKSTYIANRDATPTVPTGAAIAGGVSLGAYGYVLSAALADIASKYILLSIPSNARLSALKIQTDALGVACAGNVGAYYPTEKGGTVISAAFFASALAIAAAVSKTDITNQSGTYTIALQQKELWEALGLAADPCCNIDIAVALTAATVAGGHVGMEADYVL